MPPPKVGDQRLERGDETEIVERGRVQETREITNAVQRAVSAGLRVGKQRASRAHPLDAPFSDCQLRFGSTQRLPTSSCSSRAMRRCSSARA